MPKIVTVYTVSIDRIITVGSGQRWIKRKAEKIRNTAVVLAPMRTGRLKASHRVRQNRNALGQFRSGFVISAQTPYAEYVHRGTGPWIYPTGKYLVLPASPYGGGGGRVFARRVRGQRPNPWLLTAARMNI